MTAKEENILAINPDNENQAHVFFDMITAFNEGETRHPQKVMKELSEKIGFKVLDSVPQSMFDGWSFWIEYKSIPSLPNYFRSGIKWIQIGEA